MKLPNWRALNCKKHLLFAIKLSITVFILYAILSTVRIDDYRSVLISLSYHHLMYVSIFAVLQVLMLGFRWHLLAKSAGSGLSISHSIFGILISFFFSQGLPASIGGDAFRIWWHRKEGISTSNALKIIVLDRLYGMAALTLLCICSLMIFISLLGGTRETMLLLCVVVGFGISLSMIMLPWRFDLNHCLKRMLSNSHPKIKTLIRVLVEIQYSLMTQQSSLFLLIVSIGIHILVAIQVYVMGHALVPDQISLIKCLAAVPAALLISYMPFSIAGWGVREVAMVCTLGLFGVPPSIAIIISMLLGLIILSISFIGGLLWVLGGFRISFISERHKFNSDDSVGQNN